MLTKRATSRCAVQCMHVGGCLDAAVSALRPLAPAVESAASAQLAARMQIHVAALLWVCSLGVLVPGRTRLRCAQVAAVQGATARRGRH